ncbi:hypothetical protein J2Z22_001955 [Paenibacillus forsythiae]|uniref:N-acetyltransferase domain-containing protein n=1 Tax=Paenibacillus forsythiae TaxID=365616 RepID=A0ABU3H6H4_9BACL|nr:GNAT family N-acetyltransferase [Paenibacillus forsythiae]MDT3426429.1 hypothetical protein [Paenibacillus forsythiae]
MDNLAIKTCSEADLGLLAELNRQLIEDEQHDNSMNTDQLRERMKNFLDGDYQAYLFLENGVVRGYALVRFGDNPRYLRQFFVCRECRRQGYGQAASAGCWSFSKRTGWISK